VQDRGDGLIELGEALVRTVIALSCLALSSGAVHAQTYKVAASGQPLILFQGGSTNPDCTSRGNVTVRVVGGPQHGRVSVISTGLFPTFSAYNPRSRCNTRRVAGKQAIYVSRRGYVGPDAVALEAIYPDGRYLRRTFAIAVR
jgi:hypothetical protein